MSADIDTLLSAADSMPTKGRVSYAEYGHVSMRLRAKKYSFREIFDWLRERGAPLPEDRFPQFRSSMTMFACRTRRATERAAAKP